jgi:hypothetical protein
MTKLPFGEQSSNILKLQIRPDIETSSGSICGIDDSSLLDLRDFNNKTLCITCDKVLSSIGRCVSTSLIRFFLSPLFWDLQSGFELIGLY